MGIDRGKEDYSSWCELAAGVPQGNVLSPVLCAVFIDSISDGLDSTYHLSADDLEIYAQSLVAQLNQAV